MEYELDGAWAKLEKLIPNTLLIMEIVFAVFRFVKSIVTSNHYYFFRFHCNYGCQCASVLMYVFSRIFIW